MQNSGLPLLVVPPMWTLGSAMPADRLPSGLGGVASRVAACGHRTLEITFLNPRCLPFSPAVNDFQRSPERPETKSSRLPVFLLLFFCFVFCPFVFGVADFCEVVCLGAFYWDLCRPRCMFFILHRQYRPPCWAFPCVCVPLSHCNFCLASPFSTYEASCHAWISRCCFDIAWGH